MAFKAEYDSTEIPIQEEGFPIRSSDYNFSIEFLKPKNSLISLSYERGDYLGIKIVFRDNSLNYISNDYKKLERFSTTDKYQKLKEILAHNNIGIESRESYGENLNLVITEYAYSSFENLKANIKQSHIDAGLDVEKTLITYKSGGLVGYTEIKKKDKKEPSLFDTYNFSGLNYSPKLVLRPFIAGREEFFKYALLAELNTQYVISKIFLEF